MGKLTLKIPFVHVVQNCEECPWSFYKAEKQWEGYYHCIKTKRKDDQCPETGIPDWCNFRKGKKK